jgi:hypothetical protein
VSCPLSVPVLRGDAETPAGRLLRILLIRHGPLPPLSSQPVQHNVTIARALGVAPQGQLFGRVFDIHSRASISPVFHTAKSW